MFGRQRAPDGDIGATARRRLAALAAEYAPARVADEAAAHSDAREAEAEGRLASASDPTAAASPTAESSRAETESAPVRARHLAPQPGRSRPRRWDIDAHHLALVAVAVCAVLVVTAWLLFRSMPRAEVAPAVAARSLPAGATAPPTDAAVATGGAPASVTPPPTVPSSAAGLVVDVAGKVRRPGIVELPSGSRVVDALQAAGGIRAGVDTRELNLARQLVDGEQIVVGYDVPAGAPATAPPGPSDTPSTGGTIEPVNLNTATAEQLDTLPGIGPVTSQAILDWREENGGFTSVEELLEVSGIGDATLSDVAPYVFV